MVVEHTKFAPDRFFAKVAKAFASSDVFTTEELASLVSDYAAVTIDNGELVQTWRDKVGEKYTKLPGIRELHDFIVICHLSTNHAIMKVQEHCFEGTLQETPMKVAKGHLAMEIAIPCSAVDTYQQRNKVEKLSSTKAAHLQQMYANFVPEEHGTLTCTTLQLYQHHNKLQCMFKGLIAVTDRFDMHQCKFHLYLMHFDPF